MTLWMNAFIICVNKGVICVFLDARVMNKGPVHVFSCEKHLCLISEPGVGAYLFLLLIHSWSSLSHTQPISPRALAAPS